MSDWSRIFGEGERDDENSGYVSPKDESRIPGISFENRDHENSNQETDSLFPRCSRGVVLGYQGDEEYENKYKIGAVSVFFILVSIALNIWLMIKYSQSENPTDTAITQFLYENVTSFVMVGIGIVLHFTFVNRQLLVGKLDKNGLFALGIGLLAFGISVLVQSFIQVFFKFSVAPLDLYFIFITLSVAEEMCFRYGVQASIESYVEELSNNRVLAAVVAVTLSSLLFMLVHFAVYTTVVERAVIFGIGCVFGGFFAWTRNTDTNIIAHFLTNLIAGFLYIQKVFGGF